MTTSLTHESLRPSGASLPASGVTVCAAAQHRRQERQIVQDHDNRASLARLRRHQESHMFEWIASPEAWIALGTLTALEIVLGAIKQ